MKNICLLKITLVNLVLFYTRGKYKFIFFGGGDSFLILSLVLKYGQLLAINSSLYLVRLRYENSKVLDMKIARYQGQAYLVCNENVDGKISSSVLVYLWPLTLWYKIGVWKPLFCHEQNCKNDNLKISNIVIDINFVPFFKMGFSGIW